MTLYRGYEIVRNEAGDITWTDERGFVHNGRIDTRGGFKSEDEAMDNIDAYKRNMLTRADKPKT